MRKSFLLFLLNLAFFGAMAQIPSMGNRGGGMQNMNMGRFYGRIIDKTTNKPVDAASVQLIQNRFDTVTKKRKDFVVSGQLTRSNGEFNLEGLPIMGQFKLKVTAIGYLALDQPVKFELSMNGDMSQMMNKVDKDLGDLPLEIDSKQLEEVKVVGTKPFMQMGVDRRIFNVEKSLVSTGQTATELMRNIPGVDVDIDGNVSLRNASPTIFVDGRPTTLTLDQIPADAIASVELITNPSAKYDASGGMAGILNIVLKKNRKAGYNGNVRAGIDSRGMVNLGGDINSKQEKVNLFASGMFNQRRSIGKGVSERTETYTTPNILFNQTSDNRSDGFFAFGRAGLDYFINNRNTITVSSNYVRGKFDNTDLLNIRTDSLYNSLIRSDFSQRSSAFNANFENFGPSIGYKKLFKKSGMELTSDLNYNYSRNWSAGDFNTQYYDNVVTNPKGKPIEQRQEGRGVNRFYTAQVDFVNPLSEKSKMELGVRAAVRDVQSENLNYIFSFVTNQFIPIAAINANYKYVDRVLAAYGTYSNVVGKKFTYQLGLRVESSRYEGTLLTNGSSFENSFPFSLFPSTFLTYKLSETQDFQFSYTRRINRPNFFQLLPFVDYTDSLNINRGNPALIPEFTNSMELGYQKSFKKGHSLLASVYFKRTEGLITRFQVKEPSPIPGRDVIINTYVNANSSRAYGLELTSKNPLAKWLEVTTNLNFYNSAINGSNLNQNLNNDITSFFGKVNAAFKLPKNFSIQLTGDYRSRSILPQGGGGGRGGGGWGGGGGGMGGGGGWGGFVQTTAQGWINPNYGVDIAIRKEFLKERRGSLTLSMNDIFRTRVYSTFSESEFFVQEFSRRRDWQVLRLNFSWRFGKFDVSLFKRKNVRSGMEGMQEGMNMQQ
jgi:outer membrane receptor protein involved in Fe transport